MVNLNEGVDAISGRKRAGLLAIAARILGIALLSLLVVMTVAVLL